MQNLTKEQLIDRCRELETELRNTRKFGLVWEDKPEKVADDCQTMLPVLTEDTSKIIPKELAGKVGNSLLPDDGANLPTHLIIEGDNYHSLAVLNYTHAGKIDVIYIDPPYNTGAKDWKYNNNYVDSDDAYRHSKWLSFMEKRLRLAKNLLKDTGVLICAIDKNEHCHLGVMLEDLFPEKDIHWITVIHNPGGTQGNNFSYTHEYAIFLIPRTKERIIALQNREDNPDVRPLRDVSKGDHLRTDAKNCFYPIYVKDNEIIGFGDVCDDDYHPESINVKRKDGIIEVYPIDASGNERKWVWARHTVESIKDELKVEFNKKRKAYDIVRTKTRFNYKTVWTDSVYNANIFGTKLLRQILPDCNFDFPKSLFTVKDCISAVVQNIPNATILDFFAGSGTTGHAVLELNAQDGGNRQFILCTNNENGIAENVTYPRIKGVIQGYKNHEPIPAEVRYFKTDFVEIPEWGDENNVRKTVSDDKKWAVMEKCTEMLRIKENTFTPVKGNNEKYAVYTGASKVLVVIFDSGAIKKVKNLLTANTGCGSLPVSIYIFDVGYRTYEVDFDLDQHSNWTLESVPERILNVYQRIGNTKTKKKKCSH